MCLSVHHECCCGQVGAGGSLQGSSAPNDPRALGQGEGGTHTAASEDSPSGRSGNGNSSAGHGVKGDGWMRSASCAAGSGCRASAVSAASVAAGAAAAGTWRLLVYMVRPPHAVGCGPRGGVHEKCAAPGVIHGHAPSWNAFVGDAHVTHTEGFAIQNDAAANAPLEYRLACL